MRSRETLAAGEGTSVADGDDDQRRRRSLKTAWILLRYAFAHLDAFICLERSIAAKGIYPAVDPLASASRALDPQIVGEDHYRVARKVQNMLQRYRDL